MAIERFRPNIVLDGIEAFDEDYIDQIKINGAQLQVVKPCVRCTVPNVDPVTGEPGFEPGATLATFRNDTRAGGLTFGVNAIVAAGRRHTTRDRRRGRGQLAVLGAGFPDRPRYVQARHSASKGPCFIFIGPNQNWLSTIWNTTIKRQALPSQNS